MIWVVIWILIAQNEPEDTQPTCMPLSPREEVLLLSNRMTYTEKNNQPIPWRTILLNPSVQAFTLNLFAFNWVKYIIISWIPIYLTRKLHFELSSTSIYSVLPYLVVSILTFTSGKIADLLVSREILTTIYTRKLFQFLGLVLPSIGLILMSINALNLTSIQTVIIMIIAVGTTGFTGGGFLANPLDFSGEYSGIIYAYGNTFGNLPGFLGVYITGEILKVTNDSWEVVWLLATAINIVALVVYLIFFKADGINFLKSQQGPIIIK